MIQAAIGERSFGLANSSLQSEVKGKKKRETEEKVERQGTE